MRLTFACLATLVLASCGKPDVPPYHPMGPPAAACPATLSTIVCEGSVATTCADGTATDVVDCGATGQVCASGIGCALCRPHVEGCDGEMLQICRADGLGFDPIAVCDPAATGEHCSDAGCVDLCARAAAMRSYVGCEYLAVPTLNPELAPEFHFAVAVANPNLVAADVSFSQHGMPVSVTLDDATTATTVHVEAGAVVTARLPWVDELKGDATSGSTTPVVFPSTIARGAAYRIVSTVPVIVDQFNPLEFEIQQDCATEPRGSTMDHHCYSYTNDASLLLPTTALTGSYVAISRPTLFQTSTPTGMPSVSGGTPGFVTIVGADDVPAVVRVTTHAHVAASTDGTTVASMLPGETASFTLAKGDVLQLVGGVPDSCPVASEREPSTRIAGTLDYCPLGDDWDLTGTEIRADGRVEVISGHACDFVPFDRWACDHLEEQMFPVETWDTDAVVSITKPLRGEPNLVRVVSAADANVITFDPSSVHAPVTLGRFEHVEVVATTDVHVTGTGPIAVAQFAVGQDYAGLGASGPGAVGDPSMGLAVPSAQERSDYVFLVPKTYTTSYVNLTAPTGTLVTLDGVRVSTFTAIAASGLSTAKVAVRGGVHHATGDHPFGLLVYGYAAYTSYLYTGGLDFRVINPPI